MSAQQYAISKYHDIDEVYKKLSNLISQPLRPVRHEKMQEFLSYFDAKCKRSKELTDEAKKYIPGGVQHNLAFNYPFPIAIDKTDGAHLWDADGNQYIDFLRRVDPQSSAATMVLCAKKYSRCWVRVDLSPDCSMNTN